MGFEISKKLSYLKVISSTDGTMFGQSLYAIFSKSDFHMEYLVVKKAKCKYRKIYITPDRFGDIKDQLLLVNCNDVRQFPTDDAINETDYINIIGLAVKNPDGSVKGTIERVVVNQQTGVVEKVFLYKDGKEFEGSPADIGNMSVAPLPVEQPKETPEASSLALEDPQQPKNEEEDEEVKNYKTLSLKTADGKVALKRDKSRIHLDELNKPKSRRKDSDVEDEIQKEFEADAARLREQKRIEQEEQEKIKAKKAARHYKKKASVGSIIWFYTKAFLIQLVVLAALFGIWVLLGKINFK